MNTAYYNFTTNEYDYLDTAPEDWRAYIPQQPAAQGLYNCYVKVGDAPVEAAKKVLQAILGIVEDKMDNLYFRDAEDPEEYTATVRSTGRTLYFTIERFYDEALTIKLDVTDAEVLAEYLYKWVEKQLEIF